MIFSHLRFGFPSRLPSLLLYSKFVSDYIYHIFPTYQYPIFLDFLIRLPYQSFKSTNSQSFRFVQHFVILFPLSHLFPINLLYNIPSPCSTIEGSGYLICVIYSWYFSCIIYRFLKNNTSFVTRYYSLEVKPLGVRYHHAVCFCVCVLDCTIKRS
jgi:hypothetical protein